MGFDIYEVILTKHFVFSYYFLSVVIFLSDCKRDVSSQIV